MSHEDASLKRSGLAEECVTVITVTRGRPKSLRRAIAAVSGQCCSHVSAHIVLVDDCEATWRDLATSPVPSVWPRWCERRGEDRTGPGRHGKLRDYGARLANSPWLAYLDDDNEWQPEHLHSLLARAAETGAKAVHSWQQIYNEDGTPFLDERNPWMRTRKLGIRDYPRLVRLGVMNKGSNIFRDRADQEAGPDAIRDVDGGAWLLEVALTERFGFTYSFDAQDERLRIGEDDKFLEALLAASIPIECTKLPTLLYRLGGFSNTRPLDGSVSWQ